MKRPVIVLTLLSVTAVIGSSGFFASGRSEAGSAAGSRSFADGDAATGAPRPPLATGHPAFLSPQAAPIALSGRLVFVANTPADTVDVIDAGRRAVVKRIDVGINPAGIAVRPDGKEVWVANHISDSVSVIDTDPANSTYLQVIATVQDLDPVLKVTRFDEPVGVAFASNEKAYVALSAENRIAVINVATRQVEKALAINAQDPRAITVRGGRLYVIPFESNNQTQISGGTGPLDGNLTTFDAKKHVVDNNNVLSVGAVVDIVKHPRVPDRDLYVFDTTTDKLVTVVDTLGTLLYGLAVDSRGRVFIAQTDARNDVNGRAGTKKHGLAELENRAFLNRITCALPGDSKPPPTFIDLEPLPPQNPAPGMALATPFAIEVSDDDSTLVVSAAGSDKLFTVDAASGTVLGRTDVGAVPQGIALESAAGGKPAQAWVLNAAADTVSVVNLADPASPKVVDTITLADPTHPAVKRGRIAFSTAAASTTGTFSCASCHPDGHTDQLVWVLATPVVTGGDQIMPRVTMPCRGLRDTAPYHWDGIPGDPYGGNNSANVHGDVPPNSRADVPESSTRNLVDGALASTMSTVGDTTINDEGKRGALTRAERDDMAIFLLSVPYPPAQRRAYTNILSSEAEKGFKLFHIEGDRDGKSRAGDRTRQAKANVCGDCHRMPFWVSTNTPGTGMDAPTWRGAYDRWLVLPQGRINLIDFDSQRKLAELGTPERGIWRRTWGSRERFDPIWNMVLEGSTGFSGAYARQVTLNRDSVSAENKQQDLTNDLLDALERSAGEGGVALQAEGVLIDGAQARPVALQYDPEFKGGTYVVRGDDRASFSRATLVLLASEGRFVGTFTARLGANVDADNPQPALWTLGPIQVQRGHQEFPILHPGQHTMMISGRHIRDHATPIVDGRRVAGTLKTEGETVEVELATLPPVGMHFLQVQNPDGLFSNDFIFHVADSPQSAVALSAPTLGERLYRSRWDRLIGTWVDADTKGAAFTTTYGWKIEDMVLEVTSKESRTESVSLITVDATTGEIVQRGADSRGTTFLAKWELEEKGDAVLRVASSSRGGGGRSESLRLHVENNDTLILTLERPQPITIRMTRAKP